MQVVEGCRCIVQRCKIAAAHIQAQLFTGIRCGFRADFNAIHLPAGSLANAVEKKSQAAANIQKFALPASWQHDAAELAPFALMLVPIRAIIMRRIELIQLFLGGQRLEKTSPAIVAFRQIINSIHAIQRPVGRSPPRMQKLFWPLATWFAVQRQQMDSETGGGAGPGGCYSMVAC